MSGIITVIRYNITKQLQDELHADDLLTAHKNIGVGTALESLES